MTLLLVVVFVALVFEYINGFHDTANSIAMGVSTKVLTPRAAILLAAAHFGMPVSTTHAITTSIMGVGCAKGFNALKLRVVERILWAWVLTIPASAGVAYGLVRLGRAMGWLG